VVEEAALTLGTAFSRPEPSFEALPEVAVEAEDERRDDDVTVRGETGTGAIGPGFGDGVRPRTGGPGLGDDVPEGGLGVEGLLQDVKKSSSSGLAIGGGVSTPSMFIPSGNLTQPRSVHLSVQYHEDRRSETDFSASSLIRFCISSWYSTATRLEYFFLTSASLRSAELPCRVKKSVADAFPPTFIARSWLSCQLSNVVEL
jgi:hypothetical protein